MRVGDVAGNIGLSLPGSAPLASSLGHADIARHVIDAHIESSFLELNGIL
jgi:hypothetical protein